MKIFLSGMESTYDKVFPAGQDLLWTLLSYYSIRRNEKNCQEIIARSQEIMIDSGAHSFQKGITVPWEEYTQEYADWIRRNDQPKIHGYGYIYVDEEFCAKHKWASGRLMTSTDNLTAAGA